MPKDVLIKKEDGSYGFSGYGEFLTYYHTMQQLLGHYMQKGLMLPPDQVKEKISTLKDFLENNFQKLEDYLEKMSLLSTYIGENNESRLSAFIGKNFISSLEKIKGQLYQKELPKAKHKFDNPYRSVSDDLLDAYGSLFQKAPPLKLNGGMTEPAQTEHPPPAAAPPSMAADANENVSPQPVEQKAPEKTETELYSYVPGIKLIESYGSLFKQAKELVFEKKPDEIPTVSEPSAVSSESNLNQETPASQKTASPPTFKIFEETKEAGQRLLEKLSANFKQAPPVRIKAQSAEDAEAKDKAMQVPRQTLFKNYVSLTGIISKYMRTKDKEGYQKWYSSLAPLYKVTISINNLLKKEERSEQINWTAAFSQVSNQFKVPIDKLQKIKYETQSYSIVLREIQQNLRNMQNQGLDSSVSQALYPQLISLFENKDSFNLKKSELKMLLLQITNPDSRQALETKLIELLGKAKEMYPLL